METNARSVNVARQAGWSLAAGLAILFLAVRGDAQEQRGSIEGRVLDTAGNPVAGVNVVATSGGGATVQTRPTPMESTGSLLSFPGPGLSWLARRT